MVEGKKGMFVGMPARMGKDNKWHDIAYPSTKEFRETLNEIVLGAYEEEK